MGVSQQQAISQARLPASAQGVPSHALKQQREKVPFTATESFTGSWACDKGKALRTLGFRELPTPWEQLTAFDKDQSIPPGDLEAIRSSNGQ